MLEGKYDSKVSEPKWQRYWEENGIFRFDRSSDKEIYSVDTPPPTVSGKMHLGHAFSYSQQDIIVRFKRMRGFNIFYPFGTDDNGLPTKLLVEKVKKVKASMMSRKEFIELCLKTLDEELRPRYIADWKKIGMSCDFNIFYTTINEHCRRISQRSFIDLYKIGREYRTEAPAMHCPKCRTAISQVECEDKEIDSFFNDIIFKVEMDGKEEDLIVATTRPELLPACVGIFYYPGDERYKNLKGKRAKVPLFNFEVPIMEDKRADPEKGTGIVMCCTFGDATDAEWQKAHALPIKEAINRDGRMTYIAGKYKGKRIEEARKAIIEDLKGAGLLVKQEPIRHTVNVHERCGTPIEFVHSKQWFIKYLDLKEEMLKWGAELSWFPEHMKNRYDNWVKGLQWDWCISRQLPFGIPFPVWYCKSCDEVILAREEDLPVDPTSDKPPADKCPKCGSAEFIPEKDIINTWATSSLTPQIAAELVPELYDKIYPMSMRPQAHDIISFWLFNTVVKSRLHNGINPWKECIISGWALDPKGKKMSKSKGNVIAPQVMIEKYSADALRFWAAGSKLGEDLPFQEKDLVTGQKFITKIWNASKFVFMHLSDYDPNKDTDKEYEPEGFDRWILAKINRLIKESTLSFEKYEYNKTKLETEKIFWNEFSSNYLEIVKDRLYNPDKRGEKYRKGAQYALYHGLLSILKLMAPIVPHITEEIYSAYFSAKEGSKSIHISEWPSYEDAGIYPDEEKIGDILVSLIGEVRKFKSDNNLSLKEEISKINIKVKENIGIKGLKSFLDDLKAVTKAKEIVFSDDVDKENSYLRFKIIK